MPHESPIQQGIGIIRRERKDLPSISPMGRFGRWWAGEESEALTNPLTGSIYLNEPQLQRVGRSAEDVADTLTHELAHTRQARERGVLRSLGKIVSPQGAYLERPEEQQGFWAEHERRLRMGRPEPSDSPFARGQLWSPALAGLQQAARR